MIISEEWDKVGGGIEVDPYTIQKQAYNVSGTLTFNANVGDIFIITNHTNVNPGYCTFTGADELYKDISNGAAWGYTIYNYIQIIKATSTTVTVTGAYGIIITKLNK